MAILLRPCIVRSAALILCFTVLTASAVAADTSSTFSENSIASDTACSPNNLLSLADRGRSDTTPCVPAKNSILLESGYYQNASQVGGTALAAYPLLHLRYGLTGSTEIFLDPATAIAKSGARGMGIYTWSRSGGGIREKLAGDGRNALAFSAVYTPQSDETASLSTRERYQLGLEGRVVVKPRLWLSGAVGNTIFTQTTQAGNQQSSLYARAALTKAIGSQTAVSALFGRDAHITKNSEPQTQMGVSVQQRLTAKALFDTELGSALNSSGGTKAHYLGFGFSFLH